MIPLTFSALIQDETYHHGAPLSVPVAALNSSASDSPVEPRALIPLSVIGYLHAAIERLTKAVISGFQKACRQFLNDFKVVANSGLSND